MTQTYFGSLAHASDKGMLDILPGLSHRKRPVKEQNLPYKCLGYAIVELAEIGASDDDLRILLEKGIDMTLEDVAKVYLKYEEA